MSNAEPERKGDSCPLPRSNLTLDTYDGRYRIYTTAVITAGVLWLVVLVWERGFLEGDDDKFFFEKITLHGLNATTRWLMWTLTLLLWALVDGIVAYGALYPNLKDLRAKGSNGSILFSLACVVFMNAGGVVLTLLVEKKFAETRMTGRNSEVAHMYIITCMWISMAVVNVLFFKVVYMRYKNEYLSSGGRWFRVAGAVQDGKINKERTFLRVLSGKCVRAQNQISNFVLFLFGETVYFFVVLPVDIVWYLMGYIVGRFRRQATSSNTREAPTDPQNPKDPKTDSLTEKVGGHPLVQRISSFIPDRCQRDLQTLWASINEDSFASEPKNKDENEIGNENGARGSPCSDGPIFRHSAWILGAIVTGLILLVYFSVRLQTAVNFYILDMYKPARNCVLKNHVINREVLRVAGYGGSYKDTSEFMLTIDRIQNQNVTFPLDIFESVITVTGGETLTAGIANLLEIFTEANDPLIKFMGETAQRLLFGNFAEDHYFNCRTDEPGPSPHPALAVLNIVNQTLVLEGDPIDDFLDTTLGRLVSTIDMIIINMEWASYVGMVAGIVMGIKTILSVLAQYKRSLLEIQGYDVKCRGERAAGTRTRMARIARDPKRDAQDYYPLSATVHFLGILVSTVGLQLLLFFLIVSVFLAVLASMGDLVALIKPFIGVVLAITANYLFDTFIVQRVVGERFLVDGYRIVHPRAWMLFWMMYSLVHLILGMFFAILRLVVTLFITLMNLNRLDMNLFPALKSWDTGEISFGASVMMHFEVIKTTQIIQEIQTYYMQPGNGNASVDGMDGPATTTKQTLANVDGGDTDSGSSPEPGLLSRMADIALAALKNRHMLKDGHSVGTPKSVNSQGTTGLGSQELQSIDLHSAELGMTGGAPSGWKRIAVSVRSRDEASRSQVPSVDLSHSVEIEMVGGGECSAQSTGNAVNGSCDNCSTELEIIPEILPSNGDPGGQQGSRDRGLMHQEISLTLEAVHGIVCKDEDSGGDSSCPELSDLSATSETPLFHKNSGH